MTAPGRVLQPAASAPAPAAPLPGPLGGLAVAGGRFISRGRLTVSALYWLGWITFSRRSIVSAGVQRELDALGVGATRLVVPASVLVGLIATLQIASQLLEYGAQAMSGRAIGWFAARELGPLSVSLLIVARSASAIAGELATMRANGEIDALRAMSLDPVKYLVSPKLGALLVALPLLTILADGLIVFGAWVGNIFFLHQNTSAFFESFRGGFYLTDVGVGLAKAVLFAFVLAIVAADEGLNVQHRIGAIGEAATRAVVGSLIGVLAVDTAVNVVVYFGPRLL